MFFQYQPIIFPKKILKLIMQTWNWIQPFVVTRNVFLVGLSQQGYCETQGYYGLIVSVADENKAKFNQVYN